MNRTGQQTGEKGPPGEYAHSLTTPLKQKTLEWATRLYSYVEGNPLVYIDPSGLWLVLKCGADTETNTESDTPSGHVVEVHADLGKCSVIDDGRGRYKGFIPQVPGGQTHFELQAMNFGQNNQNCSVSASSINNYLGTKSSPMIGQGTNFMNTGARYNLDPRLLVSLSGAETGFGKNITAGQFNAFNVLYNGLNSPFNSFQSAINSVGHSLTNPRNGYNLSNTATMYHTYCSTGTTCAAGLNNLNTFMREQAANINALHYPCKKD